MAKSRISLSTLVSLVAVAAVTCAIVRWGLGLPNLRANALIQEIVIGGGPMVSLLGFGLGVVLLDRPGRRFWLGFLAFGSIALVLYASHAYFVCKPGTHYSGDYEVALNAVLRRSGMTWVPGEHGVRYAIVIVSLVALLALPQVLFAILGGWLAGRGRRTVVEPALADDSA